MTNNTQLVSVPRELLVRLLAVYSSSPWPAWYELAQALEAAPAEDVRAVVEEPVAWMQFDGEGNNDFTDDHETAERWAKNNGPKYADWLTPLYRHPQRPVVLPERIIGQQHGDKIAESEQRGWNACLDAFEELNK